MNRLNNKGQSLAIFIVFIPVVIMMGTFIVDLSFAKYNEIKLNNINKMIIKYGLKNIDNDPYISMVDLIYKNDSDIDNYNITINPNDKTIRVSMDKSSKGFFGTIIKKDIYIEKSVYVGKIVDDKIIIEKGV